MFERKVRLPHYRHVKYTAYSSGLNVFVDILFSHYGEKAVSLQLAEVIERTTSHLTVAAASRFREAALPAIRQGVAHGFLRLVG